MKWGWLTLVWLFVGFGGQVWFGFGFSVGFGDVDDAGSPWLLVVWLSPWLVSVVCLAVTTSLGWFGSTVVC